MGGGAIILLEREKLRYLVIYVNEACLLAYQLINTNTPSFRHLSAGWGSRVEVAGGCNVNSQMFNSKLLFWRRIDQTKLMEKWMGIHLLSGLSQLL